MKSSTCLPSARSGQWGLGVGREVWKPTDFWWHEELSQKEDFLHGVESLAEIWG